MAPPTPPSPPPFCDLGSAVRDLIEFGFVTPGSIGVSTKTRSSTRLKTCFSARHDAEAPSEPVVAELETTWATKGGALNLTQNWNSDRVLGLSIDAEPCKGFKASVAGTTAAESKDTTVAASLILKRPNVLFSLDTDTTLPLSKPVLRAAAVFVRDGWFLGAESVIDSATQRLDDANIALGYTANDVFMLHSRVNAFEWMVNANVDASRIGGSVYQFVNKNIKTGVRFSWDAGADTKRNLSYDLAAHYFFHKDASLSSRVNESGLMGLGLRFLVSRGVVLNLGLQVHAKDFWTGDGTRLGLNLEMEQ